MIIYDDIEIHTTNQVHDKEHFKIIRQNSFEAYWFDPKDKYF